MPAAKLSEAEGFLGSATCTIQVRCTECEVGEFSGCTKEYSWIQAVLDVVAVLCRTMLCMSCAIWIFSGHLHGYFWLWAHQRVVPGVSGVEVVVVRRVVALSEVVRVHCAPRQRSRA